MPEVASFHRARKVLIGCAPFARFSCHPVISHSLGSFVRLKLPKYWNFQGVFGVYTSREMAGLQASQKGAMAHILTKACDRKALIMELRP